MSSMATAYFYLQPVDANRYSVFIAITCKYNREQMTRSYQSYTNMLQHNFIIDDHIRLHIQFVYVNDEQVRNCLFKLMWTIKCVWYKYVQIHRESQEERSIFWEVTVSAILSKKMHIYVCRVPNGFRDTAISLQGSKQPTVS
jgi:hypothetical protein